MLLESVRSALERRGYDVTSAEPTSTTLDPRDRWRPPDVVAQGDDDLACWVVDQVQPSTVIRAQAAARGLEARPLLVGEAVDEGAQPWARRFDVEVLDPDALEGLAANGSNGSHGAVDDAADPEPEASDDGEPAPSRPALGAAPPAGDPDPAAPGADLPGAPADDGSAVPPADGSPDDGSVDVLSLLDVPGASDDAAGGPPAWLAPRPVPWEARPGEDRDEGEAVEVSEEAPAGDAGPPAPSLAGAPPGPATRAPSPGDADGQDADDPGDRPRAADPPPPPSPEPRPDPGEPEPAPQVGDPGSRLPWDPADADPPDPPTNGHADGVNPPGTPLASRKGSHGSDRPEPEAPAEPEAPDVESEAEPAAPAAGAPADEPAPAADADGPGTTSLDALVEAAAQSPQSTPGAPAASEAPDPSPDPAPDEVEPDLEPETLGDDSPPASASTDPQKIAEDVMREQEAAAQEPDEPDHTSPNPLKTGSELLNADGGSDPEPAGAAGRDDDPEPSEAPWQDEADDAEPSEAPWEAGDDVSGPGPADPLPRGNGSEGPDREPAAPDPAGDELRPAEAGDPVGADDAAMRRHEPALWDTGGRLDDVRTSLRDAGDSFHARAREKADDAGWLDDLDGDG